MNDLVKHDICWRKLGGAFQKGEKCSTRWSLKITPTIPSVKQLASPSLSQTQAQLEEGRADLQESMKGKNICSPLNNKIPLPEMPTSILLIPGSDGPFQHQMWYHCGFLPLRADAVKNLRQLLVWDIMKTSWLISPARNSYTFRNSEPVIKHNDITPRSGTSHWEHEVSCSGRICSAEIGKCYKPAPHSSLQELAVHSYQLWYHWRHRMLNLRASYSSPFLFLYPPPYPARHVYTQIPSLYLPKSLPIIGTCLLWNMFYSFPFLVNEPQAVKFNPYVAGHPMTTVAEFCHRIVTNWMVR